RRLARRLHRRHLLQGEAHPAGPARPRRALRRARRAPRPLPRGRGGAPRAGPRRRPRLPPPHREIRLAEAPTRRLLAARGPDEPAQGHPDLVPGLRAAPPPWARASRAGARATPAWATRRRPTSAA